MINIKKCDKKRSQRYNNASLKSIQKKNLNKINYIFNYC